MRSSHAPETDRTDGAQIMVVSDERFALGRLVEWLEEGGYSIATISDGTRTTEPIGVRLGAVRGASQQATSARGKNLHAAALGRLGGRKGGQARAEQLTPERRLEIARNAARARWRRRRT
jgi:hypothetical protein